MIFRSGTVKRRERQNNVRHWGKERPGDGISNVHFGNICEIWRSVSASRWRQRGERREKCTKINAKDDVRKKKETTLVRSRPAPTLLPPIRSFHLPLNIYIYMRLYKDIIICRNMIICTYIYIFLDCQFLNAIKDLSGLVDPYSTNSSLFHSTCPLQPRVFHSPLPPRFVSIRHSSPL